MSHAFNRFEAQLQRLIEEGTARLFSAQDTKAQIAASLLEAMHIDVHFGEGDALIAPGIYTIHTNAEHAAALKSNQSLQDELKMALATAAAESGIQLSCEPVLHIAPEEDLGAGEFRVRSAGIGESLTSTQALRALPVASSHQVPPGAFLIVGGAQIVQLSTPIVNIGRKKDNDLVIENSAVSRRHAQLRAISGHFHFFDLGSTGGSKVNSVDVKSAVLLAGDVISLAGVPLIYGQDSAIHNLTQTQELKPYLNGSS